MSWKKEIIRIAQETGEYVGRFVSSNAHAQPIKNGVPAQHRLLSVIGMFLGWVGGDKIRDALFAKNKTAEGDYEEVKRKDVSFILRPIHGKIKWDPFSDSPDNKWKEILHQTLPAVTAAAGTLAGSEMMFQLNGKTSGFIAALNRNKPISTLKADTAAQYAQSRIPSILAASTAGAGASSTLPAAFSAFINLRFILANNGKINLGNSAGGNWGSEKALAERMDKVVFYVKSAANSGGKIKRDWAEIFVKETLKPMFGKVLNMPEEEEKAVKIIHETFQGVYDKHFKAGLHGEGLMNAVSAEMKKLMGDAEPVLNAKGKIEFHGFDKFVQEKLKYNFDDVTLGNAVPEMRFVNELVTKNTTLGKKYSAETFQNIIREQRRNAATSPEVGNT